MIEAPTWEMASVAVAIISGIAVRFARQIALKKAVLDFPNERSSHTLPVPRLGGAAFIPVMLMAVGWFGAKETLPLGVVAAFLAGALALYVVSVADDFRTLSAGLRFTVQFIAAGVFVWAAVRSAPAGSFDFIGALLSSFSSSSLPISQVSPVFTFFPIFLSCVLLILWVVGLLNIYNFMDGIDGIAGVQASLPGRRGACLGPSLRHRGSPFSAQALLLRPWDFSV